MILKVGQLVLTDISIPAPIIFLIEIAMHVKWSIHIQFLCLVFMRGRRHDDAWDKRKARSAARRFAGGAILIICFVYSCAYSIVAQLEEQELHQIYRFGH
jgi:hypothetical protein